MIDRHLRHRYSRQTVFPGIGEAGQEKMIKSTAVVIGCGALGGNIANLLVRAGVGKVRIVDRDFIEEHNLQRQVLFTEDDIKERLPKAVAAARHLSRINSFVDVEGIVADVNFTNIERFCSGADVILDGLDNAETRFLLNDVSLKHGIPWVYGGAVASVGMTMTVIPGKTPCYRCITPALPGPGTAPTCETAGVVGTVPAVIGALQATGAMKILVGGEVNRGLTIIDVWRCTCNTLELGKREDCPACHGKYEFLESAFALKTTSLCGQSRAVQVVNAGISGIDLQELAARLGKMGKVECGEHMLQFHDDDREIIVFPDGRAIIKNIIDEELARQLYETYIGKLTRTSQANG